MKSEQLQTFTNDEIGEIRGVIKDGEPWFLAGNVCRVLGIKNSKDAISSLKRKLNSAGIKVVGISYPLLETNGGRQKVCIISESVLYELIFNSRKAKAVRFRAWVTHDVLPALRKYGEYRTTGKIIRKTMTDSIKMSGENDRMHGHGYSVYTKLVNKSLGLADKVERSSLSPEILEAVAFRENLVKALIDEGKQYGEIKEIVLSIKK